MRRTAALLTALAVLPAAAEPVQLDGVTFSDELGGVVLLEGWGSGRLNDPFVLVEEITDTSAAIITIRGLTARLGNRIGSQHTVGFALTKVVRNGTRFAWPIFDLELRRFLDQESPYEDGLSFGQGSEAGRPFSADGYAVVQEIHEPLDAVVFSEGLVAPGETVVVSVVITDTVPKPEFFLLQLRGAPVAGTAPGRLAAAGPP